MELRTWKQLPEDDFTCVELPCRKMVEIVLLNGGKIFSTVSSTDYIHWVVTIPDDRMDSTFTIIRDLRAKGMKFDGMDK